MWWNAIPIVGKVIEKTFDVVDKAVLDKDEALKVKATLEDAFRKTDLTKFSEQIKAQASIINAEANGESWLQRNWRPGLMALFGIIIANNYVFNPYLSALLGIDIMMTIPPDMWGILKLGVGGYIVGRSAEKTVKVWKEKAGGT